MKKMKTLFDGRHRKYLTILAWLCLMLSLIPGIMRTRNGYSAKDRLAVSKNTMI